MSRTPAVDIRALLIEALGNKRITPNPGAFLKQENKELIADIVLEVMPKPRGGRKWRVETEGREQFNESGFGSKKEAISWFAEKVGVPIGKIKSEFGGAVGVYYVRAIVGPGDAVTAWIRSD